MLTEHEKMLIDIYRMTTDQAHETIGLTDDGVFYTIRDTLAGPTQLSILWKGPVPKKEYEQRKAWADAQKRLGELRDLRAIKAVIAAHTQFMIGDKK